MASDEFYWFPGDGELRCALESFCAAPPSAAAAAAFCLGADEPDHSDSSRKRSREEGCTVAGPSKSKACREKIRRDKLNERFLELGSILDPSRPPRADKAGILGDAARLLGELRSEAQKLKESNAKLLETIKDLKAEKNDIRDEKMRLKADKEKLEQQIKAMTTAPPPASFMPHPMAFHPIASPAAAFAPQAPGSKTATAVGGHFAAYPTVGMWHWLPPTVRDITHDTKLWPPSA